MRLMVTRRHYDCNRKETSMSGTKQKSQSVSKAVARRNGAEQPADSRAGRTRARINGASVILLHRRSYDNMRVSDITKKAGVGRATFYAHFTSKDDLLRSQLQRVVVPMLRMQPRGAISAGLPPSFFEHIRTAPHIYKALMGGHERNGARVIREAFEQHLGSALTTTLAEHRRHHLRGAGEALRSFRAARGRRTHVEQRRRDNSRRNAAPLPEACRFRAQRLNRLQLSGALRTV